MYLHFKSLHVFKFANCTSFPRRIKIHQNLAILDRKVCRPILSISNKKGLVQSLKELDWVEDLTLTASFDIQLTIVQRCKSGYKNSIHFVIGNVGWTLITFFAFLSRYVSSSRISWSLMLSRSLTSQLENLCPMTNPPRYWQHTYRLATQKYPYIVQLKSSEALVQSFSIFEIILCSKI